MTTLYDPVSWQSGDAVNLTRLDAMDDGIRGVMPVGAMMAWPLPDPPTGFLVLNGAEVSRASYPELWAFVNAEGLAGTGKPYGVGDGSTTFVLPNLQGRVLRGVPVGENAGETGGSGLHAHANPSTSSAGAHAHGNPNTSSVANHSHSNPNTSTVGDHQHSIPDSGNHNHSFSDSFTTGGPSSTVSAGGTGLVASFQHSHSGSVSGTTSSAGNHDHGGVTVGNGQHAHSIGNTGSAGGHAHSVGDTDAVVAHSHAQADTTVSDSWPPYMNMYWIVAT